MKDDGRKFWGFLSLFALVAAITNGGWYWLTFLIILGVWANKVSPEKNVPTSEVPPLSPIPPMLTTELPGGGNSNEWATRLTEICSEYSGTDYYVAEMIPKKKIDNARGSYLISGHGRVIALVDATLFGSAVNGMAISTKGISWRNETDKKPTFLSWQGFSKSEIKRDGHDVAIGVGRKFNMSGFTFDKDKAVEMLKAIQLGFTQWEIAQSKLRPNPAENVVDIASASYEELLALPGIGAAEAKILLKHRESGESFRSIDEMADLLNLKPHIADRLKDRVTISKQKASTQIPATPVTSKPIPPSRPNVSGRGRTID